MSGTGTGDDPSRNAASRQSLLHRLNGGTLISVTFIHDFLELTFELTADDGGLVDTARLDCLVWPDVVTGSEVLRFGNAGYRDALCQCMAATVTAVEDDVESGLHVRFPIHSLVIKPTLDELVGPEIAVLRFFDAREWAVWRPGEETFADLA